MEQTAGPQAASGGVVLENVPCAMGCDAGSIEVARGRDRVHGGPGEFVVVRCSACGLLRTSPRPSPETIGLYYPTDYGPYEGARDAPRISWLDRLRAGLRWDGTRDLLPRIPRGAALEVGCASGNFLQKLQRHGWRARGVEPSPEAAERARRRGFDVFTGPLETAPDPTEPLDLIVGSHVFEHLYDPLPCFRRLRSWSKPGAYLTCAVPNADGYLFRRFLGAWYDLDLPRHLFHFTPATLTSMLSKTGWKVVKIRGQRTLNGLAGSLGYSLRDATAGRSRLGDALLRFPETSSPLKALSVPLSFLLQALGQTGRMVIWARASS